MDKPHEVTSKEFEIFKESFLFWKEKFGLTDWQVYFAVNDLDSCFAALNASHNTRSALVELTREVRPDLVIAFDPAKSGLHEAAHLLLADFSGLAFDRFVMSSDLLKEEERIVNRLVTLLKDR